MFYLLNAVFAEEGQDNETDSSKMSQDEDILAKRVSSPQGGSSSSPVSASAFPTSPLSCAGSKSPPWSPTTIAAVAEAPRLPDTPVSRPKHGMSPINHQFPDWLSDLKKNFKAEIVEPCSARTREAVENDDYIEVGHFDLLYILLKV